MLTLTDRDNAVDMIHYRIIDVLEDWMVKEKRNLDDFRNNPEGHVNYNPYLVVDFDALTQRSIMLGSVAQGLVIMSGYKKDSTYTRTQHDEALDDIPVVVWQRLYDWMGKRISDMEKMYGEYKTMAPLKDYIGLLTFDSPKFLEELAMYKDSYEGLGILIQYEKEQASQTTTPTNTTTSDSTVSDQTVVQPPPEETP